MNEYSFDGLYVINYVACGITMSNKLIVQFTIYGENGGNWQVILEDAGYRMVEGSEGVPAIELNYKSLDSFYFSGRDYSAESPEMVDIVEEMVKTHIIG